MIQTSHYWTIIALEACGHVPEAIIPTERDGRTVLVYEFPDSVEKDQDAWMRGESGPDESQIFDVVRKVQSSVTQFKSNLYRYSK